MWKDVMTQKLSLKKYKEINSKGNEMNLMNQYGEKLLNKKSNQDQLAKRIQAME